MNEPANAPTTWTLPEKDWSGLIPGIIQAAKDGDIIVCMTDRAAVSVRNYLRDSKKRIIVKSPSGSVAHNGRGGQ